MVLYSYTHSKSPAVTGAVCTTTCVGKHAIPSIKHRLIWDTTAYFQLKILTLGCGKEVIEMEFTKHLPIKWVPVSYEWDNKKTMIDIVSSNKDEVKSRIRDYVAIRIIVFDYNFELTNRR